MSATRADRLQPQHAATAGPTMRKHVLTVEELDAAPWASCGPTALAALLGRSLDEIRHAFPVQEIGRTWTNSMQMHGALDALGILWRSTGYAHSGVAGISTPQRDWPRCGLVLIQFRGAWDVLPINHPAQLQHTHWIAAAPAGHQIGDAWLTQPAVFDMNGVDIVPEQHGWTTRDRWVAAIIPMLAEGYGKKRDGSPRATGEWWVRAGIEVLA